MALNENSRGPEGSSDNKPSGSRIALHPLHEVATRIADLGLNRPRAKTRDLVGLLLCHGARAWRYSQPEANIHLHIACYSGRLPVHLRIR